MFAGFMINTWAVAAIVAPVAGVTGFFVVSCGSWRSPPTPSPRARSPALLARPSSASAPWRAWPYSLLGALGIGILGRRHGRHDVATALTLVMMLALGAAFLSRTTEYEPEIYSLLFGEVLGVSSTELLPVAILGALCIVAVTSLYRPLTLASAVPGIAEARGVRSYRIEICFLIVVVLATVMTVPVAGALLIFSLMIGPPAAARSLTSQPARAIALSVAIALVTVRAAIAASYLPSWPVGFFVGTLSALSYATGRSWAAWHHTHTAPATVPALRTAPGDA